MESIEQQKSQVLPGFKAGNLSPMAVYTDVSFEDLERLLEQYDIGQPLSFKGIAEGIENSNFYLQTDRGAFILTLYEKRVAAEDLPFFLGLMEHLAERGMHCPLPVKTRDGQGAGDAQPPQRRHRHLPDRHRAAPPRRRPLRRRRRAPWPDLHKARRRFRHWPGATRWALRAGGRWPKRSMAPTVSRTD